MFKTITKELSKNEVIDLLRGMDAQEVTYEKEIVNLKKDFSESNKITKDKRD